MPQVGSVVLGFGLGAIPVRLYAAMQGQTVRFNLLHDRCGTRIQNRNFCPVCNEIVDWHDLARSFRISKHHYVRLTEDQLDGLEAEANQNIESTLWADVELLNLRLARHWSTCIADHP